jgi:hypothetical protein
MAALGALVASKMAAVAGCQIQIAVPCFGRKDFSNFLEQYRLVDLFIVVWHVDFCFCFYFCKIT